jgi:hypothetical protein
MRLGGSVLIQCTGTARVRINYGTDASKLPGHSIATKRYITQNKLS